MRCCRFLERTTFGLAVLVLLVPGIGLARDLSLEERVEAQKALERVYYAHQIGATRPFEEAVPREIVERKVRRYLDQSVALETLWHAPITREALLGELARMVQGTRMPERLRELYAALDDDPVLILECLARPALADRLSHGFFAYDERFHGDARREAEQLALALRSGVIDPHAERPDRSVVDLVPAEPGQGTGLPGDASPLLAAAGDPPRVELSSREWTRARARLPRLGEVPAVREDRERFVIQVVLEDGPERIRVADFSIAKPTYDAWWAEVEATLDERSVPTVGLDTDHVPVPALGPGAQPNDPRGGIPCLPDNVWDNGSLDDVPSPGAFRTSVWTGSHMLVWGAGWSPWSVPEGWRYDPSADTWAPISRAGAPSARLYHTAVWTGSHMVVWGGEDEGWAFDTGGRYDPETDTWLPTSTANAPAPRWEHTAVWTGSRMIVWGGYDGTSGPGFNTGGRYDPETDTWAPTSTTNAPSPRIGHTAVWTGSRMVVWGGDSDTGGRYDPETDTWIPTSTANAPSPRRDHTAVWTGSHMVVWGGVNGATDVNTGGQYDPETDSWTATSLAGAPAPRVFHTAVWTGDAMIVWGGVRSGVYLGSGGRYDPETDTWTATSGVNAPSPRSDHAVVWTGTRMLVWGGYVGTAAVLGTGGRYEPETDTWTPTFTTSAPAPRSNHTAVWTGSLMVVWGGSEGSGVSATGARYDPATDAWTPTATTDAPSRRSGHTVVWTGSSMIVWGGIDPWAGGLGYLNTGGNYDPYSDTWTPTSVTNAPVKRVNHVAVWTGSELIVWGGTTTTGSPVTVNTGGRYDPETDTWIPTSTFGAPMPRWRATAVWTGAEMIVWGGHGSVDPENTGGRYDPENDTWTPTSTTNAASPRYDHTAVWTGNVMVVWGGHSAVVKGGRYDPVSNTWMPTSTVDAPSGRYSHTAVWTGKRMIVWGGGAGAVLDTGGSYDPVMDGWAATSIVSAATPRADHTAVWANGLMIVWGGFGGAPLDTGGLYAMGNALDDDGDGLSECLGDCDDGNAGALAVPAEVTGLIFEADKVTLSWDSAAPAAGTGTVHDVVRGRLSGLPVSGSAVGQNCIVPGNSFASTVDPSVPFGGQGYWYLVRGRGACGAGTYGFQSDGVETETSVCP